MTTTSTLPFQIHYERTHGEHHTDTFECVPVTALSFLEWEGYVDALRALPRQDGYIISSELVTAPSAPHGVVRDRDQIESRIEEVVDISKRHPHALLLLGTPTFDEYGIVRNSLVHISNGGIVGYTDKVDLMSLCPDEAKVFSEIPREPAQLLRGRHGAIICANLITALLDARYHLADYSLVHPATSTLLVSSRWATPNPLKTHSPEDDEQRYRQQLERVIRGLFMAFPNLLEIIMVDASPDTSVTKPYNVHCLRGGGLAA